MVAARSAHGSRSVASSNEGRQRPEDWTVAQIVEHLSDNLGPKVVAYMVGKSPQTVSRWAEEKQRPPQPDVERKLRGALQIFQHLVERDSRHVARAWFIGMNPQLEDRSPTEVIADGDVRAAMAAARAFSTGG
ncbi:hypothetical protein [Georgenia sp. Z1491]|uniref:hypothetical protein n=1 Tax=Georgenia sp. Z1491 TaxID=3416707 RepID=UPI003CF0B30C